MDSKKLSLILAPALTLSILQLAQFFKISPLFGYKMASFSLFTAAAPLTGLWGASFWGLLLYIGIKFFKIGLLETGLFTPFSCYIPTMVGSMYVASTDKLVRLYIPFICLLAFVLHPVGGQAIPYALFWLIPIFLYFMPFNNPFTLALGATFVQHAVGSIIWLYCMPMMAADWLALIPVVAIERLVFALTMVVVYTIIQYVKQMITAKQNVSLQLA